MILGRNASLGSGAKVAPPKETASPPTAPRRRALAVGSASPLLGAREAAWADGI